jgi:hypothetical protein
MRELLQTDKIGIELHAFWDEIVIQNGPRYRDPRQWLHLWTDFWVALCDASYTVGHIVAVALPIWAIVELVGWVRSW